MVNRKKLLAMLLVFTMTFSYFGILTEAIATTSFISLFGGNSDTGNENIEFEAYLANGEELTDALVSDVNQENLAIRLQLGVKQSGYLKNAKVEMKAEDEQELNFSIKEDNTIQEMEKIQSLQDNILEFNKIENAEEPLEISIPIVYKMEEYMKEEKLNSTVKVILSGIYVDDKGKENEISKEVDLTLAWKDDRAIRVDEEVSKYIQFGEHGVILQTVVRVDSTSEAPNSLPTKATELNITVPKINDKAPTEVNVIANSTLGTNGKGVGEVQFSQENCSYQEEEGIINIRLENQKQLVEVDSSEEYLKEEETKQEERYYSKAGIDEYVITYTFEDIAISDEMPTSSKIEAKRITFSGVEADNRETITTAEKVNDYILTGQTGNMVSYHVENETKEVSKIYAYLNKEVEYNSKIAINVSHTDMVEEMLIEDVENNYIDKAGNKTNTDDIYYKQISVSQANFNQILGEDGKIEILDVFGNTLTTITKENATDENGNYVVTFQDKISKIMLKTSAPISTGNLIITNQKATSQISISKTDYANMESIATTTVQKAKFTYVSDRTELGSCTTKTTLKDTMTNMNLVLDRDTLSTVTTNSNVEMRLELNNDEENLDIYGNSIFEIEMPEYVTSLKLTNASMLYGEGLNISNVETYVKDGKIIIKVTVDGTQTDLNSGVLTNGTNIVLNADIDVDRYAPKAEVTMKAYCYNSQATNYANPVAYSLGDSTVADYDEQKIQYSAPTGVVAINTMYDYDKDGSQVTSIKQGKQVDYIDVYSQAKVATMEVAVVNNNENAISNVSILGRIPFKGVKDIETKEDLGTTIHAKMVSAIKANENNAGNVTIYYSTNGEATKDLDNSANGWTTNPENFENVKSYLLVSNDTLNAKQALKFTYQYEIPASLAHNQAIFGTFLASYTNHAESGDVEEIAKPDLVGLTTGVGPELELDLKTNVETVKENDEIKLTATVKNVGEDIARNIVVNIPLPKNTTLVTAEASRDTANITCTDGIVVAKIENLSKDATLEMNITAKVGTLSTQYTDKLVSTVTAKDLNTELQSNAVEIKFEIGQFSISQIIDSNIGEDFYYKKGDILHLSFVARNLGEEDQENVTVETTLPKELEFSRAYGIKDREEIENAVYEEASHKVIWKVDKIEAQRTRTLKLDVVVGELSQGTTAGTVRIATQIYGDLTEKYNAQDIVIHIGKSSISVTQTSATSTYVAEGTQIDYTFLIKNESVKQANNVVLTEIIPDGLVVKQIAYEIGGNPSVMKMSDTNQTKVTIPIIPANSEVAVNVTALAANLNGAQEKTVTNIGTISGANTEEITSNSVTHIIQATENSQDSGDTTGGNEEDNFTPNNNTNVNTNPNTNTDITKTYKITGIAWLDVNKNGMRENDEQRMSNITAMLVDSTNGVIKATTTTGSNGEYSFSGVQNGSYLVLFKYDTTLYTTTTYRKEGIETSLNSDVVTTKIEQNGKRENGAVTDIIQVNGANMTNIDIGLVETAQFSLGIDKAITKVTVQNAQGTKTEEFDKAKLTQLGMTAKYLAGTNVYVEYTVTVTNNGDLAGFASEIVDYLPQGMTFNSGLNPDWYTGTDGNLYTKALADIELAKGESREIKLVLSKQMTKENTGIVSNTAEIANDFNIYGVSDKNSTPLNRAQGEDDISTADIILTVKTGDVLIYLSAIIIITLVGGTVGFVVYGKVMKNKTEGGV